MYSEKKENLKSGDAGRHKGKLLAVSLRLPTPALFLTVNTNPIILTSHSDGMKFFGTSGVNIECQKLNDYSLLWPFFASESIYDGNG